MPEWCNKPEDQESDWCSEHETLFFKKGKMQRYAHPIEDGSEPKKEAKAPPKRDSSTNDSIEAQVAVKAITELVIHDKLKPETPLAQSAINWMTSKLMYWSSQGGEEVQQPKPEAPTADQKKRLTAILKKWDAEEARKILVERWHTNETKHLSQEGMEDFINQLSKKQEPIEPDDLPF